jgi:type IV pilus assembly protein PilW
MERVRCCRQSGFSLVELMVAMVLGLLVAAGIVSVFLSTSKSNRVQTQMASLQEEGRFVMTQIKSDLSMANGQYCSNSGGNAHRSAAGTYLDGLRAPVVYASGETALIEALDDVTTPWGGDYPTAPKAPYSLPSFLSMRGYDCDAKTCTPIDPSTVVKGIPTMGAAVDKRVVGASVLTLRYLEPSSGWAVAPSGSSGSTFTTNADGSLTINLKQQSGEPDISNFKAGDTLAMLADCSRAQIYAVTGQGSSAITSTSANFTQPVAQQGMAAPKLFDFNHDYQTVTYYLRVVDNGDGSGHTTGALMRRVNGVSDELARGVERLDFKYGVQHADGSTWFYTATDVDASTSADCSSSVPIPIDGSTDRGCLWRAVTSIEVNLLMDGQVPLYTLAPSDLSYTYAADGIDTPKGPEAHGITPAQQGFPTPMIRREFTMQVSVRNFNP